MKNMMKSIIGKVVTLVVACTLSAVCAKGQATIVYLSPSGSPGADGTRDEPFGSIAEAIGFLGKQPGGDALVLQFSGGMFRLPEGVKAGSSTPFAKWSQVSWRGSEDAETVISGNRLLDGQWRAVGRNTWRCAVDESFNQLFVNRQRAVRARFPNAGDWLSPDSVDFGSREIFFADRLPSAFARIRGAELHATGVWHWNRQLIERIDPMGKRLVTATHPGSEASHTKIRSYDRIHLENAREFLDEEGEWFLDTEKGQLYYYSVDDPSGLTFEYPGPTELLIVRGQKGEPVRDFRLEGITFEGSEWHMTATERKGLQAGFWGTGRTDSVFAPPAALLLEWVENSQVTRCTFRNLGEGAIALGDGCAYNVIESNRFHDVGSNVLQIGYRRAYLGKGHPLHLDYADSTRVSHHNLIRNNRIEQFGTTDLGAVGIWVGYAHNNRIDHNRIKDFPYCGISVGWYWGTDTVLVPTNCYSNTMAWNHISHGMRYLSDGAGIYAVGNQPGTVIHDNFIHDIFGGYTINSGIYIDEGGANMTITGNYFHRLENPREAFPIKLHKNAIPTMRIFNNGGEHVVHRIGTNPHYEYGKNAEVPLSLPPFPGRYGIITD